MNKQPFSRFNALMAAASALLASLPSNVLSLGGAINQLGGYKSRGKGRSFGMAASRRGNRCTDWLRNAPHGGGAREVARRQRQLAAGTLRTN